MGQGRIAIGAEPGVRIDPRVFGGFLEHLGRAVYGGIYEPGHPLANADGMRADVIELVKELGVTMVRYPGGSFVSAYNWEDGVGPREQRPQRLDLAWHTLETNAVGVDEFMRWAASAGVEPMMAVNLGTRGVADAIRLLEYCNAPVGSLADWRREHGRDQPYGTKLWCLGNEMDGPWQIGHRDAREYGRLADQAAHAMKAFDDSLELVACGSSGPNQPWFDEWTRDVLRACYRNVDYVSCHWYTEETDGDLASFLAGGVVVDRYIDETIRIADEVGAELGSDKRIDISFDEWNVWNYAKHRERDTIEGAGNWPFAPPLLEESYTAADAVVTASFLMSFLAHAERVKIACLAQVVNAIAPIMTVPGGPAWRQTIFYPFALMSPLAGGRLLPLDLDVPTLSTAQHGDVPAVQAVAARQATGPATLLVANRRPDEGVGLCLEWPLSPAGAQMEVTLLGGGDPHAVNSADTPDNVLPAAFVQSAREPLVMPPASWARVRLLDG